MTLREVKEINFQGFELKGYVCFYICLVWQFLIKCVLLLQISVICQAMHAQVCIIFHFCRQWMSGNVFI